MKVSLARVVAFDTYVKVFEEKRAPEDVLELYFAEYGKKLSRLDRNFCKELVFGTLRWHAKMLWILQNTSKRDLNTSTAEIRTALLIGTYQIFYMDRVPDRAAVNESVEYLRHKGQSQATSFVNGILRQISRKANYFAKPDKEKQQKEYLALQFSHPEWVVGRWLKRFKFEKLKDLLSRCNYAPPYSIRVNSIKTPFEESHALQTQLLKEEKTHSERRSLRSSLRLKTAPATTEDSLFGQGLFTIQDEASQLIAPLLEPKSGESILDMCAGPGGKLSHTYELAGGKAHITAVERSKTAMRKARETTDRLGHIDNITWVEGDVISFEADGLYDKILLDAPCSGLGVLRRHPEGRWLKPQTIISDMANVQRKLLERAWSLLKPGGRLVYSVCSAEPEESLDQLQWLKETYGDSLVQINVTGVLPDYFKKYTTRDDILLVYPGNADEMDGFAAFIIEKTKS